MCTGFLETLINVIFSIYEWFICWDILKDYEEGVVLRLGKYHRKALAGWNWRLPFGLEEVMKCNVVPTTADLPPQAVVTADGTTVIVEVVVLWGVSSPRKYLLEVEDGRTVLTEAGMTIVYDVLSCLSWEQLHTEDIDALLTDQIRARARKWGVRIKSAEITSMSKLGLKEGCFRIAQPATLQV